MLPRLCARATGPSFTAAVLSLTLALAAAPRPALAGFHLIEVYKILAGYNGDTSIQAVELRMIANAENLVSGGQIVVYDAAGIPVDTLGTFAANLPASGAFTDRRILCATANFQGTFGIVPDLVITPGIPVGTGQVSFEKPGCLVNAVAYGNVTVVKNGTTSTEALPAHLALALVRHTSNATVPSCPLAENAAARVALRSGSSTAPIPFTNNAGASVNVFSTLAGVEPAPAPPPRPRVAPNPFRASTTIEFLGSPGRIAIHDIRGRLVREWNDLAWTQDTGPHGLAWDGRDTNGRRVSAGIYFVRVEDPRFGGTVRVVALD